MITGTNLLRLSTRHSFKTWNLKYGHLHLPSI
jgi:hypothetical protein